MKRLLWIVLAILPLMQVLALTDQEIMQSAITLRMQGLADQEIAKELIRQGATIEQLQRVSSQAMMMQQQMQSGNMQTTGIMTSVPTLNTQRQNNGETFPAMDM